MSVTSGSEPTPLYGPSDRGKKAHAKDSGAMSFAAPVMTAAGLAGEATSVRVLRHVGQPGSRDRILAAESAIAEVQPKWIAAAEQEISALCPGWIARYDIHSGNWRARRINRSGYYRNDSPRAYLVRAPGALCVFSLVERQALLDIAEDYPDWHAWPGQSAWCALPDDDTTGDPPRLLSAATAAALAAVIADEAGREPGCGPGDDVYQREWSNRPESTAAITEPTR